MKSFGLLLTWIALSAAVHAAPKLIAHRGASHAAPENTLAAFRLAWEEGADGIEGDFHLTADGEIVCCHDFDTERTAGVKHVVADTSWAELRGLDVGSWKSKDYAGETMPLLGEVLALLPEDKVFFIEIKCGPEVLGRLKAVLAEHEADPKRVFIISFNEAVVAGARKRLPEYPAHLVSSLKEIEKPGGHEAVRETMESIGAMGLQFSHKARVRPEWLRELRKNGRLLASWTIDDPAEAARIAGVGVDFITTNRPAAIREETGWPAR